MVSLLEAKGREQCGEGSDRGREVVRDGRPAAPRSGFDPPPSRLAGAAAPKRRKGLVALYLTRGSDPCGRLLGRGEAA
ncbi:hypothetical protein GCM10010524_04370 [Streptomyces mexicanus]